jgi:hypothetical protein
MVQSLHKAEVRPILGETDCRIRQLAVCIFYEAILSAPSRANLTRARTYHSTMRRALVRSAMLW